MRSSLCLPLVLLLIGAVPSACKTPRPPLEVPEGKLSGDWIAYAAATGRPAPAGELRWRLLLEEEAAGKLRGRGAFAHPGGTTQFTADGLRGERVLNLELRLGDGSRARYAGSMLDARTLVGEVYLRHDTLAVVFRREGRAPP